MSRPKVSARRVGTLITFRRVIPKTESRSLTIDIWAPPKRTPYDIQQWFLGLFGTIWWDIEDAESLAVTTRDIDQFTRLLATHRDAWVAEQKAGEGSK